MGGKGLPARAYDYLLAIFMASESTGGARLSEISRILGVSAPTAHEYLSMLVQKGLVRRDGRGVYSLSEVGSRLVEKRVWAHGVFEEMLVRTFSLSVDAACVVASLVDAVMDEEDVERICEALGHPRSCPHGLRIPHRGAEGFWKRGSTCIKLASPAEG